MLALVEVVDDLAALALLGLGLLPSSALQLWMKSRESHPWTLPFLQLKVQTQELASKMKIVKVRAKWASSLAQTSASAGRQPGRLR